MRLVRLRKAPVMPLHDTARMGPMPSLLTTTSTFFVFNPPEDRCFTAGRGGRIEVDETFTAPSGHDERRPGLEFVRVEAALQDEAAGHVPVEWLDVLPTLGRPVMDGEIFESLGSIHPLALPGDARRPPTAIRHRSVSMYASSKRLPPPPVPTARMPSRAEGGRSCRLPAVRASAGRRRADGLRVRSSAGRKAYPNPR